jgi:hypothetical protein
MSVCLFAGVAAGRVWRLKRKVAVVDNSGSREPLLHFQRFLESGLESIPLAGQDFACEEFQEAERGALAGCCRSEPPRHARDRRR